MTLKSGANWSFWVDRGGTFTDLVARHPDGRLLTLKLLSECPEHYGDAVVEGMRRILDQYDSGRETPVASIRLGTTVGTNALLEGKGEKLALVVNQGFKDALWIGNQSRPDLFSLHIQRPQPLYERVIEVRGRLDAEGHETQALDLLALKNALRVAYEQGCRALAVSLLHAWKNPAHENAVSFLAAELGFKHISLSHQVSPGIRLIPRGSTTVLDAYLSPVFDRYKESFVSHLKGLGPSLSGEIPPELAIMQSNGGLSELNCYKARDSILSGPAGGMIAAKDLAKRSGFDRIITFDMGGTSTDVAHYAGELERAQETEVQGRTVRVPTLSIHTVAAGGGSILKFDGARFLVGPESAGANPGPACYRKGGPLTVTDANLLLGKIRPEFFPMVFGSKGKDPIDSAVVQTLFVELSQEVSKRTGLSRSPESLAEGFIEVAVEEMALAIQKISTQRGYDLRQYALFAYGAAGGQQACLVAERLGIQTIILSPYAGVLSALGMGLAQHRLIEERAYVQILEDAILNEIEAQFASLRESFLLRFDSSLLDSGSSQFFTKLSLRYEGSEHLFEIPLDDLSKMREDFQRRHERQFGFTDRQRALWVEKLSLEWVMDAAEIRADFDPVGSDATTKASVSMYLKGRYWEVPVYDRQDLSPGVTLEGPAMVLEPNATTIIEPGWRGSLSAESNLILHFGADATRGFESEGDVGRDPLLLQLFNARLMAIAEEMGFTLQKTAASVNIRERLDFSCAIFDAKGHLVANAPHIPVHLGSMGACVESLVERHGQRMKAGDVWLTNSPYAGGTHLPDITVVTPVYTKDSAHPLFYVASRGHHADVGGITPGSMPPNSHHIEEEGVSSDGLRIVECGRFDEQAVRDWLKSSNDPARNPDQNVADLKAQVAANHKGQLELLQLTKLNGRDRVFAYMGYLQDHAEEAIRDCVRTLDEGSFSVTLDSGARIEVSIQKTSGDSNLRIDFTGTSGIQTDNQNAPIAIVKAAVLYVFRTLVKTPIPLNEGCLRPIKLVVPEDCFLNPQSPSAVVAGNVETSQQIVDVLLGALGKLAGSQGTMNNLTFGNEHYQYYETICGGSGAGTEFDGCDAVQTHMTNSRLTDPEVLEWKYPVRVERFELRQNSGGSGLHRGGDGVYRRIEFLKPMTVGMISNRRSIAPHGLQGGEDGKPGLNQWIQASGPTQILPGSFSIRVKRGDVIQIETPGGGGFGKSSV